MEANQGTVSPISVEVLQETPLTDDQIEKVLTEFKEWQNRQQEAIGERVVEAIEDSP